MVKLNLDSVDWSSVDPTEVLKTSPLAGVVVGIIRKTGKPMVIGLCIYCGRLTAIDTSSIDTGELTVLAALNKSGEIEYQADFPGADEIAIMLLSISSGGGPLE